MLAAEDIAREAGLQHIRLNVFGWNTRAEGLYRSLGYMTDVDADGQAACRRTVLSLAG